MAAHKWKVSELVAISPIAKKIRFNLGGEPFSFQAGQYIVLGVDLAASGTFKVLEGKDSFQERPFSISSSPLHRDFVEVTLVGKDDGFTADYFLNHLAVGEEVSVQGPLGDFFFQESRSAKHVLLIGGGSGIMPLVSIASYIAEKGLDTKVHMIFSFRDEDRIILNKLISELSQGSNISSTLTLTRSAWNGTVGRINKEMILASGLPLDETDVYICGPFQFKSDMKDVLVQECNVPLTNIFV